MTLFFKSDKARLMMYGSNDDYTPREVYDRYIKEATPGIEKSVYNGPHFSTSLSDGFDRTVANNIARYVSRVERLMGIEIDLANPPPRIKLPLRQYGKDFHAAARERAQHDMRQQGIPYQRTNFERAFPDMHVYDVF